MENERVKVEELKKDLQYRACEWCQREYKQDEYDEKFGAILRFIEYYVIHGLHNQAKSKSPQKEQLVPLDKREVMSDNREELIKELEDRFHCDMAPEIADFIIADRKRCSEEFVKHHENLIHLCKWTLAVLDQEKWDTSLQAELRKTLTLLGVEE